MLDFYSAKLLKMSSLCLCLSVDSMIEIQYRVMFGCQCLLLLFLLPHPGFYVTFLFVFVCGKSITFDHHFPEVLLEIARGTNRMWMNNYKSIKYQIFSFYCVKRGRVFSKKNGSLLLNAEMAHCFECLKRLMKCGVFRLGEHFKKKEKKEEKLCSHHWCFCFTVFC